MKYIALVLLIAACGSASPKSTTPPPSEGKVPGPPDVAWKDMTHEQKGKFMEAVVMPKFKPIFQAFDPKGFKDFDCVTCHGGGAKNKTFKMPNPDIFALPATVAEFPKLAQEKPDWMKFMPQIEHDMAATLGVKPYDPAAPDPSQFTCLGCHTQKKGGSDAN